MAKKNGQALRAASRFVRAVQESGVHLQAAYLYGSFAAENAHTDSDIDVALVSSDFTGWVDDLQLISSAVITADPRIEHVRFHPRDFRNENPLAWEIMAKGIPLVGKRGPKSPNGSARRARRRL